MLNEEQDLLPVEQQTLIFYGKPIDVVRLPDGQPGALSYVSSVKISRSIQPRKRNAFDAQKRSLKTFFFRRARLTAALKEWRVPFLMTSLSGWHASGTTSRTM